MPRPKNEARSVAFVVPDMSEAYGLDLLNAIEERCAEYGAHLVVRRTHGRQSDEEKAVDSLVATGEVDGLIVFPVHGDFYNASLLRQVLDGYPVVLVDRHLSGIPVAAVHTDNVAASRALTSRLLDRGHRAHRVRLAAAGEHVVDRGPAGRVPVRLRGPRSGLRADRVAQHAARVDDDREHPGGRRGDPRVPRADAGRDGVRRL